MYNQNIKAVLLTCFLGLLFSCKQETLDFILPLQKPPKVNGQYKTIYGNTVVESKTLNNLASDVNGDKKCDLVWRFGSEIKVSICTETGFMISAGWGKADLMTEYKLADTNGDGFSDLIGRKGNEILVSLSNGNNFESPKLWSYWNQESDWSFGDLNGDRKSDLVGHSKNQIYVALSSGTSFGSPMDWIFWSAKANYKLGDVNGDGKSDIIGKIEGSREIYVCLSVGESCAEPQVWGNWNFGDEFLCGDVNGDGLHDIIGIDENNSEVLVSLSSDESFLEAYVWGSVKSNSGYLIGDINGDKRFDFIAFSKGAVDVSLSESSNFKAAEVWRDRADFVKLYIDNLNKANFIRHVNYLCSHGSRSILSNLKISALYIENYFLGLGFKVSKENVIYGGIDYGENIVATKVGKKFPNSIIEVTAHYDASKHAGPYGGAKDNATGVSAIMEIANVLKNYDNNYTIRFVAYAAEENSKYANGSMVHVQNILTANEDLILALNIDTPGTGNPIKGLVVEDENYMTVWYRDVASYEYGVLLKSLCSAYGIPLKIILENIGERSQSDELSYSNRNLVAITSLGDWEYALYHTIKDIPEKVNYNNVLKISQANLATILTLDNSIL